MLTPLLHRLEQVPAWIWLGLSVGSVAMSIAGVAAIPWLVRRMPPDWFARPPAAFTERLSAAPVATFLRNGLGVGLVGLGVALLFLPGQGVLTIVLGLVLTDLPVRDRGLRWVAARPPLARRLQTWRMSAGVPPFEGLTLPPAAPPPQGA